MTTAGDLLARLERIPQAGWHVRARMVVGVATFFDAFDLLAIASALPVLVGRWHLGPTQIGTIISAAFVGQIVGALFFGWFAEKYGRLAGLRWTVLIFSLASLACAAAYDADSLFVARLVQGFGLGGEVPVAGAYISEIARADRRGRFFLLYEMLFGVGITCAGLMSIWIVPRFGWQAMFVIGALPAVIGLALRRLLPESPRWLIGQGRLVEAEAAVAGIEAHVLARGISLPAPIAMAEPRRERTRVSELFSGTYLRRTLMIWAAWFCTYFIVYGETTWLPTIYRTIYHLDLRTALLLGTANGVASLTGDLLVAFMIDIVGRRVWYALAFFLGALPLIVLWWIGAPDAMTVFVSSAVSYVFIGSNAVSLVLYTGELYPTRLRALAGSIATVWARIAASVSPVLVGWTIAGFDIAAVFAMFAVVSIIGAVLCGFAGVETRRRVLEDVSP